MEVKTDITFAISSSIVLHAVHNFNFNFLRIYSHNSQQAELAKVLLYIKYWLYGKKTS